MLLGESQRKIKTFDVDPDLGDIPKQKPSTRMELTRKRTRFSTRFINPDGSFTEEIYNQPMFFQDMIDRKWKRIDNRLQKSLINPNKFENMANEFKTTFTEESDPSTLMSVQKEGYNIDLILIGARKVKAVINENEITYPDILPQVDIVYLVTNDKIKEALILKAPTGQNRFSFELKSPANVTARLETNGNISILSPHNDLLWIIEKPYLVDSKGIYSNDANFAIRKEGNRTYIDLLVDLNFLNNPNMSYPITVDPTIQSSLSIRDTFISSRYPQNSYSSQAYMFTGVTPSYNITRSLVRFALPPLPSNCRITSATFQAYQINTNITNAIIDLHRINSSWGDSVTWNSQPAILPTSESSASPGTFNAFWRWEITKLIQDWYNGTQANYGIMLKNRDETSAPYGFFTTKENTATYEPRITLTYTVDPIGLEEYWHRTEEGINPSNGNLSLSETDLFITGRGIPLSIERTYNSRNTIEKGVFGYGWSSNLDVRLTFAATGPIVYSDSDGTKHYFGESLEGEYLTLSGVYLDLVKQTDGSFILTLPDKSTKYLFNATGKLQSITDLNMNVTIFTYNPSGSLQTITDASNRTLSITYGTAGFISTITVENRTYRYTQDGNGYLVGYTNAKNITKAYSYDGLGRLSTRTDGRNVTTNFAYDTSSRVNRVSRPFTVGGTVQEHITTFSYDSINNSSTRVLNNNQRTDYSYDSFGRVVQITENPLDAANMKITKFSFNNNNEVVLLQDPKNQPYVYEYDNQGNLTFEKLPENQKAYNTFDNQNNLISEQDYNQNIEQHDYDVKNNNTESIDPYVQSVSKRYNSLGNLLYQTNPMSVADNLLPNSGFEYGTTWPDFWTQVVQSGKTAQFAWSTITKFGNRSVSISNPTGWAIVHQIFDYAGGEPYVVSGYIKTANTTGRAYIKVEYFDLSMIWLGQRNSYGLIGTHDWTRLQTVITNVPAGTVKIRISFALDAGQGTAYYDAIQLEKGNVVSAYNLIENSSFERYSSPTEKIPLHWSTSGNLSTADGRYQLAESNDTRVYVGTQSIRLTGESGKNKYLAQRVLISGAALTKLTLSGWSYQEGANPVGGSFALQLGINHNDGTVDWQFKNEFSKTMQGWQHLSVEVEPTKSFQSIDVYLIYYNQTGLAWFDGLRLELGASHTSYVYDARNNYVTTIKDPLGNTINYSFDFFGNRTQQVEANGSTTIYSYNEVNELISVTDAKGFTTTYQYDGEGNITEVTNAKGDKQKYDYNQLNSLTKVTDALNRITSFEYDRFGNRTKTINADMSSVSNIFDNHNRLTSISYNNLKQFDLEYDLNDNLTKITRLNVPISTLTYDLNNRLISETESGKTTNYSYDDNSNITGLSIQGGSQINFVYNKLNLIRSILRNNAIVANYIYNESRQVSSVYFVNGTYAAYEYNGANQLIELTNYKINDLMDRYKYTYSPNGNIIRIETNSGTINYQYDQLNQLTQETFLDGTTISYEYDSVGNRTKKTVTASGTSTETTYIYNQVNQLISVNNQFIQYDLNGNMVDDGERIFVYNPDNRLIEVKVKTTGNTLAAFTYDFMGRRKTMTTTSGTVTFYYDQRDNVIYETDQSGTIHVEYTWDQENRPITMIKNGQTYYYHLNGHGDVIALTDKDGNIVASYSYNVWGIIISQSGTLSSTNPFRYAGYRYDENTNLYYLMARYYDSNIGRFISRDPYHELDEEPIALNLFAYSKNNPVKFMDRDGQNPVIAFAIGGALNSVPLLISYYSKHNNLRGFDWNRFYIAFLVGGITSVFGGAFYNLLKRAGANVISKIIGMGLYETKASILNTVSQGKKLTLTNVALNFTKGGALKGTGIVSRAWGIYKKSGLSGLQRFIGKIF